MASAPRDTTPLNALTAEGVRQTTFRQSQLAWRGYSEDEVDEFKAMVADQLVAAERERAALRTEIERLRNFYRQHGTDIDSVGGGRRRRARGPELVNRVSDHAEAQVGPAREYADLVNGRATERANEVLYQSEVRSSLTVEEWLRIRRESGRPVDPGELRQALTWLRSFTFALQVELKVIDDVLVREGQAQEAAPADPRQR